MDYKNVEKDIYLEELYIEEDYGIYYIVDIFGDVIREFDSSQAAQYFLDSLRGVKDDWKSNWFVFSERRYYKDVK